MTPDKNSGYFREILKVYEITRRNVETGKRPAAPEQSKRKMPRRQPSMQSVEETTTDDAPATEETPAAEIATRTYATTK